MAKLYFRYGTMKSGKTISLLQIAHNYEKAGMKILVIKSSLDKKGDNKITSRVGISREVDLLLTPGETIKENIDTKNLNCVIVDEIQFLTKNQIEELWFISKLCDIPVICYGLRNTFQAELFQGTKTIMALADDIEELSTICNCGKDAKFNARIINNEYVLNGEEVSIDGIDSKYEPMCPECYIKKVLKKEKY